MRAQLRRQRARQPHLDLGDLAHRLEPVWHRLPHQNTPERVDGIPRNGYTFGMKTAISLPDDLFEQAERLARRLRKSRSRLYREAVTEYVARHDPDEITAAMDAVAGELNTQPDAFTS